MFSAIVRSSLVFLAFVLLFPFSVSAHPGRTDAKGGHTCRTNCGKWGLNYGEYHYHNKKTTVVVPEVKKAKKATVTAKSLVVRDAASAKGKEIKKVLKNQIYSVLEEQKNWVKIDLGDGKEGWVAKQSIKIK